MLKDKWVELPRIKLDVIRPLFQLGLRETFYINMISKGRINDCNIYVDVFRTSMIDLSWWIGKYG